MSSKILRRLQITVLFVLLGSTSSPLLAEDMTAIVPPASGLNSSPAQTVPPVVVPPGERLGAPAHNLGTIAPSDLLIPPQVVPPPSSRGVLPSPQEESGTHYVTGGVGDEERATLEAEEKDYNLRIISADRSGAFTGITHITLTDAKGAKLLDVDAGPLLFVNLPKGTYTLLATDAGQSKKHVVTIHAKKATVVHLTW